MELCTVRCALVDDSQQRGPLALLKRWQARQSQPLGRQAVAAPNRSA
jgi:hypothetical protein